MKTGICVLKSMEMESLETCCLPDLQTFPSFRLTNNEQPTTNQQLRRFLLMILITLNSLVSLAQNITVVEYFFDSDPGYGFGTSVAITPATSITNFTFSIDITTASDGFHTLFVRAKDANNNWSAANSKLFYKLNISAVTPAPNITKIEYFFDTDPGFSSGIDVPIAPGVSITNHNFAIPLNSVTDGFHTLFVRTRNANDQWSVTYSQPFYKFSAAMLAPAPNINKIEYFLDTDPGYGAGSNVPITPAVSIANHNFTIPLSTTADGFHTLFVRSRDANNNWGAAYSRPFYKLSSSALPPIPNVNKLEYFIDADPGYGAGINVAVTPGVSIPDLSVPIPVTAITEGNHIITFRARDVNNNWSVVAIKSFSKCNHPGTTVSAATAITSSGFTASWADVPGSISYRLDVSTDNFNTFVSGYNAKVITAPALSSVVTGLSQATTYQYRVRAVASCASVESNTINLTTLATPPSAQPTNLLFSSVTSTSLTAFFTAPTTAPTGYLVVRKIGSATSFVPATNTSYTLNQNIGDGVVAYIGPTFLFNETGLAPDTNYFYSVFAYNQVSTSISYLTTSPLQNNVRTVALEPTAQPTGLQFASVTDVGFTVSYTAATGGPTGYLVLRKTGSAPTSPPVDGQAYVLLSSIGDGTVVHVGSASSFPQTGLTQNTSYFYAVYAYNGTGSSLNYRVITPLQGSQLTLITPPAAAPTGLLFSTVTASSISVAYTAATGSPSGYLVVRKPGLSSTFIPQPNTFYTLGQVLSDGTVAYVGPALNFIDNTLSANTTYFYDVFAYNQLSSLINYQSVAPLEGSRSTLAAEPAAQPTSITFSSLATTGFSVSYTAATGSPSGYLAVRSTVATPTFVPTDGVTYSVGTQGSEFISFIGAGNTFTETGLISNTRYYYAIYAFNGNGATINYRSTSPLTGDQLTLLVAPTVQPTTITFNAVTSSAMTVGFTAASGVSGYVVVRGAGATPTFIPLNNVSYTNGTQTGGEIVSVGTSTSGILNSSLAASTEYFFRVYSYNQSGSQISYNFTAPLAGSKFTFTAEPTAQASGLVFSNPTINSLTINFTAASPAPAGYLVVRKAGVAATGPPNDGQAYALSDPIGDGVVAYVGNSLTFVDNGLLAGTTYFYQVFSFNGAGVLTNYLTTVNASNTGSKITVPGKPATPTASAIGQNQFTVTWTASTGADSYRLDVSKDNFVTRVSGFDDLTVTGLTRLVSGLETGTAYKFRIRAVNISGTSVNSDEVQQFTIPATPVLAVATGVGQFGFTANWPLVTGATNYFIDVSLASDFSTFATGFQNKQLSIVGSEIVTGLAAGNTYYYRVRSKNDGGTSPNSTTVNQLLFPATPVGSDATNQQSNSFKANWQGAQGATSYRLDVSLATANFNPSLPAYNDKEILVGTSEIVSNLLPNTQYRYRIRAANGSGTSPSSIPIPVSTTAPPSGIPLQLSNLTFSPAFTGTSANISVDASGGTPGYTVVFHHRKITADAFTPVTITPTGATYRATLEASMLDEIGVEFYFQVADVIGDTRRTADNFVYVSIPTGGQKIPFTKFGGTKESYELFSIPYELTRNGAADIFDELGAIDKSKWRLSRYQNGRNIDIGAGLTSIEQGKGYWFNSKEKVDVFFSNGTVTKANQLSPFKLALESGWNQIGNPYPFNVDWDDIVNLSSNKSQVGKLKVFNAEQFTLTDESNNLKTWSGGFVFNSSTQRIELDVPVTLKNTAGGRKATPDQLTADLSSRDWFVPLAISQEGIINHTSGFGMHTEANPSKDYFDEMVVPRFINYLEFYTTHTDYFYPWFAKDMVPPSNSNSWEFNFESNLKGPVELSWIKEDLGTNAAQLFLFDPIAGVLLDMKKSNRYRFEPGSNQSIRLFYGASEKELSPDVNALNAAWPNPFSGETNISFVVKDKSSKVTLAVYDLMGKKLNQLVEGLYDSGVYSSQWQGNDARGEQAAAGLYMVRLEINGFVSSQRIIKK
jgi:hypothetical protein